ncbi:MAG: hypothetical protein ACI4RH_06285 [Huintestinicola sp.]
MENITSVKIMPVSKVFDNSHMMLTLPISEKAMTTEMLDIMHNSVDRWLDTENYGGYDCYEATLGVDVLANGKKYFILTLDVYFKDDVPPETTVEVLDLSPELEEYYYNMAIRQFVENLKHFNK